LPRNYEARTYEQRPSSSFLKARESHREFFFGGGQRKKEKAIRTQGRTRATKTENQSERNQWREREMKSKNTEERQRENKKAKNQERANKKARKLERTEKLSNM
jgi:hypothetical protein